MESLLQNLVDFKLEDIRECPNGHGIMMSNKTHGYICKTCGIVHELSNDDTSLLTHNNTHNTYANSNNKVTLVGNNTMRKALFTITKGSYSSTQERSIQLSIEKILYGNKDIPLYIGVAAASMFDRIVQYTRKEVGKDNNFKDDYDIKSISSLNRTSTQQQEQNQDDSESEITIATDTFKPVKVKKRVAGRKSNKTDTDYMTREEYENIDTPKKTGTWRSKVRLGIICACIYYECIRNNIKKPPKVLLKIFKDLEEKHLTRGCKILQDFHNKGVIVLPSEYDVGTSSINRYMAKLNMDTDIKKSINYKNFIYNFLLDIEQYNIIGITSSRTSTKVATLIYILYKCVPDFKHLKYSNAEFASQCDNMAFSSINTYLKILDPYINRGHFKPLFEQFNIPYPDESILSTKKKRTSK